MDNYSSNPVEIFKVLGDQNRLKIIKMILSTGNNLCVGMLAQKLGIAQPSVSQHLKILKTAGLIEGDSELLDRVLEYPAQGHAHVLPEASQRELGPGVSPGMDSHVLHTIREWTWQYTGIIAGSGCRINSFRYNIHAGGNGNLREEKPFI